MRAKRIAIIRTTGAPYSLGSYNYQEIGLAKGLLENGWSVDIYTQIIGEDKTITIDNNEGNEVLLIPIGGWKVPGQQIIATNLLKQLSASKYSIIQVNEIHSMMLPVLIRHYRNDDSALITVYNGTYRDYTGIKYILQKLYEIVVFPFLRKSNLLVLSKTCMAAEYVISKKIGKTNIVTVGLDTESLANNNKADNECTLFANKYDYVLLYVGIIDSRRDVKFIVDILAVLRNDDHDCCLIIIGKGPDREKCVRYIKERSLENHVLLRESETQDALASIYKVSNIFLLPTGYEIFGMVILEALYFGLPVIASCEAGPMQILDKDDLGKCLDKDINEWIRIIKKYLSDNKEECRKKRTQYVLDNFIWKHIANRYIELLTEHRNSQ